MSIIHRRPHKVPGLNTSSLPDLIFTVLFFFMIVTHMQKDVIKVKYRVPDGTRLTRLVKKSTVSYIYIGRPSAGTASACAIQINDRLVTTDQLANYILAERRRMSPEDSRQMTVSIKADRHTKMSMIEDVKEALQRSGALKICYSASEIKQ